MAPFVLTDRILIKLDCMTSDQKLQSFLRYNYTWIKVLSGVSTLYFFVQDPVLFCGNLRINLDPFDAYTDDEVW